MGSLKDSYNISEDVYISRKFTWLTQIIENMSVYNNVICDPAKDPLCTEQNFSFVAPELIILNETEPFFDWDSMGDRQDPYAIPMTIVYLIILITGVIGNVCTCIVIARNRYMHTATNYYLFSLAISDLLLLLLGMPQDFHHLWSKYPYIFGEAFCILRGWCSETSTNASILTITAFTVERYLAICHPIRAHTMSRLSRAIKFIIVIWIIAALASISMGYQLGIIYEKDSHDNDVLGSATCSVKRPLDHAFEWSTFLFFFFPATVLCILYALIGLQLRRSTDIGRKHDGLTKKHSTNGISKTQGKILNEHGRPNARKSSCASRKDVIKMLVAVVIAFFICWAPFHAQRLMAIYITDATEEEVTLFGYITNISGVLYYVSATINPILYSILSLKFRHAFRDTLGRCLSRGSARRNKGRHMSLYNSTLRSAGYEITDLTIVSEVGHQDSNGSRKTIKNLEFKDDISSSGHPVRKKTGSTISNTSMRMTEAFDDSSISEYIDQMKDSQC